MSTPEPPQQGYERIYAPPAAPPQALAERSHCQGCGRQAPVAHVTFMQNVGAIVLRFPRTVTGFLCRRCISHYFWRMTTITLFFGWWGYISFFYSLVSIPRNIANFIGARKLPDSY